MPVISRRQGLGYAAYTAAVVLLLLYLLFPSQALRAAAARRVGQALPGAEVTIGDLRPGLPFAVVLSEVAIAHGGKAVATIERLRVVPELALLFREAGRLRFSGALAGGTLTGGAETAGEAGGLLSLSARLEGAQLEKIPGLQAIPGGRLSGTLSAEVAVRPAGGTTARLSAADARVELAQPLFDQRELTFRTIDAELGVQGRRLLVRSARLKGSELDAELAGTIALDPAAAGNALNLNGKLTPHHALAARLEGSLPPNFLRRRGGLAFKLTGSIAAPGFALN
jgi:type II secretion system protein N